MLSTQLLLESNLLLVPPANIKVSKINIFNNNVVSEDYVWCEMSHEPHNYNLPLLFSVAPQSFISTSITLLEKCLKNLLWIPFLYQKLQKAKIYIHLLNVILILSTVDSASLTHSMALFFFYFVYILDWNLSLLLCISCQLM